MARSIGLVDRVRLTWVADFISAKTPESIESNALDISAPASLGQEWIGVAAPVDCCSVVRSAKCG